MDSSGVMKPSIHSYLESTEPLFGIVAGEKWGSSMVMRPSPHRCPAFSRPQNEILQGSTKLIKGFHKLFSPRFHTCKKAFLGNENVDYALTGDDVNLEPRASGRLRNRKCKPPNCLAVAQLKPLSEVLMILEESHIHVAKKPRSRSYKVSILEWWILTTP